LEGDKPIRFGSRALDILIALVERPGEFDEARARQPDCGETVRC
jgi:hypothetical protein